MLELAIEQSILVNNGYYSWYSKVQSWSLHYAKI